MATKRPAGRILALPDDFQQMAMAFPDQIRQALATMDSPDKAADALGKADTLAAYARRIRADTVVVNALQYGKLLIIAKLATLMPREKGGRGKTLTGTASVLRPATVSHYRKIGDAANRIDEYNGKVTEFNASLPEDAPEIQEMSAAGFIRFVGADGKIESVLTGNTEWYTPEQYIKLTRKVMGGIDLDPASNDYAQKTVKAKKFYTEDDDGLQQAWWGRVFLNPPYKMPLVQQFADKLCEEYLAGTVKQAVFLTDSATDTHWWQESAKTASVVCFTEGRIKFYNPSGVGGSPTRGQTFMYFGKRLANFCRQFENTGIVMRLGDQ